jgi:WD40 repeat protein/serine/threonine protein kinase
MADSSADRNPIDLLAEEFAERYRRGEQPSVTEYAEKYPDLAGEIRDLFPALLMMEDLKPGGADVTGGYEPVPAPAGTRLEQLGDYRILREVGRGGMGVVYEAEQVSLGRHVALKVLPAHALLDPQHLHRFHREARAAARLHHTNIVPVYGVGEADGLHYYVMQFIHGHGLDQVIRELRHLHQQGPAAAVAANSASESALRLMSGQFPGGPTDHPPAPMPAPELSGTAVVGSSVIHLPGESDTSSLSGSSRQYWHSVARIGIQAADALAYASSQGILHRDVKPSNLLLDTQGIVWITDFGLAKVAEQDNLTHTGDIVGTLRFMAPERFEGQSDLRSDLYALGLTLYELLTLRQAFDETDRGKLMQQVMHHQPPPPRTINPEVPRDLETIVQKCIAREPQKRYQTATEVADDLRRFVDDKPIRARRVGEIEKLWLWCRRNPAMAGLMAALVLVFLAGFAGVAWKWREAVAEREAKEAQRQAAEQARDHAAEEEARAKRERERAQAALYSSQIARARLEYQTNNVRGTAQLLQQCDVERRGWEWNFLHGLCHAELFTLGGHSSWVNAVACSPDGKLIVTAGGGNPFAANPGQSVAPGEAIVWDAATGKQIRVLRGHRDTLWDIAFSPGGNQLATCSADRTARLWDVATGRQLRVLQAPGPLRSVAFRPDGQRLAAGCDDARVYFWDVATGEPARPLVASNMPVWRVRYSPDSHWLATAASSTEGGDVRTWNAAELTPVAVLEGGRGGNADIAFSPDSRILAGAGGSGITLWEVPGGKLLRILAGHTGDVHGVAFSADGRSLASAGVDTTVRQWSVASGLEEQVFRGHANIAGAVAFHPTGDRIVSGSDDGTARVWDVTSYLECNVVVCQGWSNAREREYWARNLEAIGYTDGGREIVFVQRSGDYFRLDSRTYAILQRGHCDIWDDWMTPAEQVCIDGEGRSLVGIAAGNRRVAKCWDLRSGKERATLRDDNFPIQYVTISADGGRIATSGAEIASNLGVRIGQVRVWDASDGRVLFQKGDFAWIPKRVALSPRGDRVAVASISPGPTAAPRGKQSSSVRVYNVATGEKLHEYELQEYDEVDQFLGGALAFSADGSRLASADESGNVVIWDLGVDRPPVVSPQGPRGAMDVAFSPDGRRLLVASRQMTKMFDAATGEELLVLRGQIQRQLNRSGFNPRVRFSPNGQRVLSICHDGDAGLAQWSIEDEQPEVRRHNTERRSVQWRLRLAAYDDRMPKSEVFLRHYIATRDVPLEGAWEHLARAHLHAVAGDEAGADADIDAAMRLAGTDATILTACGDARASRGNWQAAGKAFEQALAQDADHLAARCGAADVCLQQSDRKGYEAHCRELLRRFGGTADPRTARELVRRLLSAAVMATDAAAVLRLADCAARAGSRYEDRAYLQRAKAIADFRAGRFARAIERFTSPVAPAPHSAAKAARSESEFYLAIAHHHLGHAKEARASLAAGRTLLEEAQQLEKSPEVGNYWADWVYARAAAAEAEAILGKN